MEVTRSPSGVPAEAPPPRRPVDPALPKDGPLGQGAPEPQRRGEAVVFGGSLANSDRAAASRDSDRQRKVDRQAEREQRADARREHAQADAVARRARRQVDISV